MIDLLRRLNDGSQLLEDFLCAVICDFRKQADIVFEARMVTINNWKPGRVNSIRPQKQLLSFRLYKNNLGFYTYSLYLSSARQNSHSSLGYFELSGDPTLPVLLV